MKLAHIVPVSCLHAIPEEASAHLALSNLIIENPRYAGYYRQQVREGKLVILDNPVHEDVPNSLERFVDAVLKLQPPVAVLPDIIDDISGTIISAEGASKYCTWVMQQHNGARLPAFMAVPHGFDTPQFVDTAAKLIEVPGVSWIGVTLERRLKDDPLALLRRRDRVLALANDTRFNGIKIHLLGLSESAIELEDPSFARVASVDTSKFVVLGLTGSWVYPPAPLTLAYPGREGLGPRNEYFHYRRLTTSEGVRLQEQLRTWSAYAERDD